MSQALSGTDLKELQAFLKGPSSRLKFKGLANALKMEMERIGNRGPTPEEVQAFVKQLRDGRKRPVVVE